MNPGRFYIPRMGANMVPMMGANYLPTRGNIGLFGRIASSLRSFNWGGLLNGANKTLNIVNQTIPLVRQAGPMLNNMKSLFRIAKAFGSETNNKNALKRNNSIKNNVNNNYINSKGDIVLNKDMTEVNNDLINNNYPNFFI